MLGRWIVFGLAGLLLAGAAGCGKNAAESTSTAPPTGYYVDATAGDDANAGTPAAPWRTLARAETADFSSLKTIFLKRGGTWLEPFTFPVSGLTLAAYGTGAPPLLDGRTPVDTWTSLGGGLYSKAVALGAGEGLGNVSMDGVMMTFQPWDTDAVTSLGTAPDGSFTYDYATGTLYIRIADAPSLHAFLASVKLIGVEGVGLSNLTVNGLELVGFSLHGIHLQDCAGCTVRNTTLSRIGGAVISPGTPNLYAGNGIEFGNASTNGLVDGVTVSDVFDSCLSPQTYQSGQAASGFQFSNSSLTRCGFAGVEISVLSNGGSTGSSIQDVSLSGLSISDTGTGWSGRRYGTEGHGIRIGADAGAGTISGVTIAGTDVSGAAGTGIRIFGEAGTVTVSATQVRGGAGIGIDLSDPGATTAKLVLVTSLVRANAGYGLSVNLPAGQGVNLYQDTFYANGGINLAIFNQAGEALIENNLFDSAGDMAHLYTAAPLAGTVALDHNCYREGAGMIGYNGANYATLAAFRAAESLEVNGASGANLMLADPANGDLSLNTGSPCIGVGATGLGITTDYAGKPFASPPSAGALEY